MVLFLSGLVLTPLNKMVVYNENIVTFLMLSAPFSFLPLFLSAFGVRPYSLLCTPLTVFLHQLHITTHNTSLASNSRKEISSYSPSPLLTSLLISLPRLTRLVVFEILYPNSSWLPPCHLKFERRC